MFYFLRSVNQFLIKITINLIEAIRNILYTFYVLKYYVFLAAESSMYYNVKLYLTAETVTEFPFCVIVDVCVYI